MVSNFPDFTFSSSASSNAQLFQLYDRNKIYAAACAKKSFHTGMANILLSAEIRCVEIGYS